MGRKICDVGPDELGMEEAQLQHKHYNGQFVLHGLVLCCTLNVDILVAPGGNTKICQANK